mmetsp:Transcript_35778/g.98617  ORF Transcript_35778/g.98617 Transcript_35778/m.98617 type:complete len:207 (-) Transcript_35778:2487-3107(-)
MFISMCETSRDPEAMLQGAANGVSTFQRGDSSSFAHFLIQYITSSGNLANSSHLSDAPLGPKCHKPGDSQACVLVAYKSSSSLPVSVSSSRKRGPSSTDLQKYLKDFFFSGLTSTSHITLWPSNCLTQWSCRPWLLACKMLTKLLWRNHSITLAGNGNSVIFDMSVFRVSDQMMPCGGSSCLKPLGYAGPTSMAFSCPSEPSLGRE